MNCRLQEHRGKGTFTYVIEVYKLFAITTNKKGMHPLHQIEFTERTSPFLSKPPFQTNYLLLLYSIFSTFMKDVFARKHADRISLIIFLHIIFTRADAARSMRFIARIDLNLAERLHLQFLSSNKQIKATRITDSLISLHRSSNTPPCRSSHRSNAS